MAIIDTAGSRRSVFLSTSSIMWHSLQSHLASSAFSAGITVSIDWVAFKMVTLRLTVGSDERASAAWCLGAVPCKSLI